MVRIGAGIEQSRHHLEAGVLGGPSQRRDALVLSGVGVGAGVEEPGGRCVVVPVRRPKERRCPVGAAHVDVYALIEELIDTCRILLLDSRDQAQVLGGDCTGRERHHGSYQQ